LLARPQLASKATFDLRFALLTPQCPKIRTIFKLLLLCCFWVCKQAAFARENLVLLLRLTNHSALNRLTLVVTCVGGGMTQTARHLKDGLGEFLNGRR